MSSYRFELPGGLSPTEEAAVIAALERYFAESDEPGAAANPWAMAGRLEATGMGALQARGVTGPSWRSAVRMPFARGGVPTFHGRGDAS